MISTDQRTKQNKKKQNKTASQFSPKYCLVISQWLGTSQLFLSSILGALYLVDISLPIIVFRVLSVINIKTLSDILGIRLSFHLYNHIYIDIHQR